MARSFDRLMRLALALFVKRPAKPRGVLLVSARGPAEMVFLAPVLPRFMAAAEPGEDVTLLMRSDAVSMSFLFPRGLRIKRLDVRALSNLTTRWALFRQLWTANYRMVVSLDLRRDPATDEALLAATGAPRIACIASAPAAIPTAEVFDPGPARRDRILRLSHYANALSGLRHAPTLALLPEHRLPEAQRFEVPTVVIFPFSAILGRQLPTDHWTRILDALPRDWHVRVAGHHRDFERNPQFKLLLDRPRVSVDTSGFDHLASVLLGARMAIGADTAGMHLAILLGVPTLMVASAAWVGAGVPYDHAVTPANAHFLFQTMDCQGCLDNCPFDPVQGMLPCVAAVDPERVKTAIADMIARGGY